MCTKFKFCLLSYAESEEEDEDEELFEKLNTFCLIISYSYYSNFGQNCILIIIIIDMNEVAATYNFTNKSRNQNAMQNKIIGYVCIYACVNYILGLHIIIV